MVHRVFLVGVLVCVVITGLPLPVLAAATPPARIISTESPPAATDDIVVSTFRYTNGRGFDYVELYNTSEAAVDARDMAIVMKYSAGQSTDDDTLIDYECEIPVGEYIKPKAHFSFALNTTIVVGNVSERGNCPAPGMVNYDRGISIIRGTEEVEKVQISTTNMNGDMSRAWERRGYSDTYRKGTLVEVFKLSTRVTTQGDIVYADEPYMPMSVDGLVLREVMPNPALCGLSLALTGCRPYIKIANTSSNPILLDGLRLRSGGINEKSSIYNTSYLTGSIPAHSWKIIDQDREGKPLAIDRDEAAIWFEDMYGVVEYGNNWAPYTDGDTVAHRGKVWAYDMADATWKWGRAVYTSEFADFTPEPLAPVEVKTKAPCKDGQYRSEETGKCRNIALAGDTLRPCKEGQYRSEETGRCRSIARTVAAELKPCNDDQFRNPATGRCKKIASVDDVVAPCDAGWERNPQTHRCRKIKVTDMPLADFPVQQVAATGNTIVSWLVMGGVVALGVGYAAWEWRHEAWAALRKLISRGK